MRKIRYILPVGFLFVMLLSFQPLEASACSCVMPPPPEDALNEADAVFSGEVVEVDENRKLLGGSYGKTVHFKVDETWKGIDEPEIAITTGLGGGDCGISFEKGQKYLVYASASNMYVPGTLSTTICHRTTELANAAADLNALGEGEKIKQPDEQIDESTNFPWWAFAIFILGLIAIFIGFRVKSLKKARS